ncbi:MAG: hypothetical protein ACXAEX_18495, partial [Promethearchaeota archaeon]
FRGETITEIAGIGSIIEEHIKIFVPILEDAWVGARKEIMRGIKTTLSREPTVSAPPPKSQQPVTIPPEPKPQQPITMPSEPKPQQPITMPPEPKPQAPLEEPKLEVPELRAPSFLASQYDDILKKLSFIFSVSI